MTELTGPVKGCLVLKLYVAGSSPNAARALSNLNAICEEYLNGQYDLEIVDVLAHPLRPLADGILVSPTLLRVSPAPSLQVIGDLSDKSQVLHALGIVESLP